MSHSQLTDLARQMATKAFAQLGVAEPEQFRESVLIRDGIYCGRRFEADGAHAVWFVEESQLKVISADGRVLRFHLSSSEPSASRRAA